VKDKRRAMATTSRGGRGGTARRSASASSLEEHATRKGRRVLEDFTLALKAPDALSELAQLLALGAGQPVIAPTPATLALATRVTSVRLCNIGGIPLGGAA
jgi:hypothetical protein